jgi:hypothetical protein
MVSVLAEITPTSAFVGVPRTKVKVLSPSN